MPKVFVSGCFDMFHSGHVAFLQQAATFGELWVSVGSDRTFCELKGNPPVYNEKERLFIVKSLKCVNFAFIAQGSGKIDFKEEFLEIKPDIFIVNGDGDADEKWQLAESVGADYKVLPRTPYADLPIRTATKIKESACKIPYRIDLAGGWLDQPFVSKICPGAVVNMEILSEREFDSCSGMGSSTRKTAQKLWGLELPYRTEESARLLFGAENPLGSKIITGSQDSLGICLPGLKYLHYSGDFWPDKILQIDDADLLSWLNSMIHFVPLGKRKDDYNVMENVNLSEISIQKLADAAEKCLKSILAMDKIGFGQAVTDGFNAQREIFPSIVNPEILAEIEKYKSSAFGYKLAGAGGGGYLVLISEDKFDN